MNTNRLKGKSRYITYLLRHHPQKEQLTIDDSGWVSVEELTSKLNITNEDLQWIVDNDNKTRFSFNLDKTKIRANQGHSIDIDLKYVENKPPDILFHGTAKSKLESIFEKGLIRMGRHHVHLSSDYQTALQVGGRHGKPVVLKVLSGEMYLAKIPFFRSENGVWLTEHVPPEFLKKVDEK